MEAASTGYDLVSQLIGCHVQIAKEENWIPLTGLAGNEFDYLVRRGSAMRAIGILLVRCRLRDQMGVIDVYLTGRCLHPHVTDSLAREVLGVRQFLRPTGKTKAMEANLAYREAR